MAKNRSSIPKQVSESVLKEYRHRCAVCGRHDPHLHHLNEDPTDHDPHNLLPLCPNCHLQDAHDPTTPPHPYKLRLFRKYKDPLILDPRFHPIFCRMLFLRDDKLAEIAPGAINRLGGDLLEFVAHFKMGGFYRKKLKDVARNHFALYAEKCSLEGRPLTQQHIRNDPALRAESYEYRNAQVESLVVELIRYQEWTAKPTQQTV